MVDKGDSQPLQGASAYATAWLREASVSFEAEEEALARICDEIGGAVLRARRQYIRDYGRQFQGGAETLEAMDDVEFAARFGVAVGVAWAAATLLKAAGDDPLSVLHQV